MEHVLQMDAQAPKLDLRFGFQSIRTCRVPSEFQMDTLRRINAQNCLRFIVPSSGWTVGGIMTRMS